MLKAYEIANKTSGLVLGIYGGRNEAEALDIMAQDADYRDQAHAEEVTGNDRRDLIVTDTGRPWK